VWVVDDEVVGAGQGEGGKSLKQEESDGMRERKKVCTQGRREKKRAVVVGGDPSVFPINVNLIGHN